MSSAAGQSETTAVEKAPEDPAKAKQLELAKTVAFHLLKGVKQIGMYRHNEAKFGEFLQKACDALNAYTAQFGPLQLKVELTNFTLHKQELFNEDSPLPYRFFKDGIRQLLFREGLSVEELVQFVLISLSDPDRGAEDLHAQLWRAQLSHVEFIMVQGFKMDEFGDQDVQVEVDQVVDYLQKRLRTNSDDYLRFARISEEDLDAKLEGIEQMRGVVVSGSPADATLKARVQKEIHEEENQRLFPKLVSAVFQVVESGVDDPKLLTDMFAQLLDAMLLQEDFATINQVVLKLRAMEQRLGGQSAVGTLLRDFTARMADEQRLSRIGDLLKRSKPQNTHDIVRYLTSLAASAALMLLDILEVVEVPENRALLCDVLVPFAKGKADPFVNRLRSDRPQTVRDMIYVLDRAGHPDRLKFFGQVLSSPNLALRLEVMAIIAKGRTGEARKLIAQCLDDPNLQVRLTAARVLPDFDREKAYLDLLRVVKDVGFTKKSTEEREALYAALGSTGAAGAIQHLQQLLSVKPSMFNKAKVLEDKIMAVHGLIGAATIQTYKLLQDIAQDKNYPPEVCSAAKVGLVRTKKTLFGSEHKEH